MPDSIDPLDKHGKNWMFYLKNFMDALDKLTGYLDGTPELSSFHAKSLRAARYEILRRVKRSIERKIEDVMLAFQALEEHVYENSHPVQREQESRYKVIQAYQNQLEGIGTKIDHELQIIDTYMKELEN